MRKNGVKEKWGQTRDPWCHAIPEPTLLSHKGCVIWRQFLIGWERVNRTGQARIVLTGGAMTDSRVASDDDPASARMLSWAAAWRRWLGALNAFLERAFLQADVDTGC